MAIFSMTRILNGISGRVSPERVMVLRCGRDVQSAYIIESAKYDLHLSLERPVPAGEIVEFSVSTGFPVEVKVFTGVAHWSMSHRVNPEIGVALSSPVPPELIVASGVHCETIFATHVKWLACWAWPKKNRLSPPQPLITRDPECVFRPASDTRSVSNSVSNGVHG